MGILSNRVDRSEIKPGDHIYTWRAAFTYSHHGIYVGENKVVHFTAPEDARSGSGWNLSSIFPSSCSNLSASRLNLFDSGLSQPKSGSSSSSSSCSSQNLVGLCLCTPDCGFHEAGSGVILSCLNCFIGTGSLYLYQYGVSRFGYMCSLRGGVCTIAKSDPPEEVILRATYLLPNGFGSYDMLCNNCEDFALYCKTGLRIIGKSNNKGSSGQANSVSNAPWKTAGYFVVAKLVPAPMVTLTVVTAEAGMHCWSRYKTDIGVRKDVEEVKVEEIEFD